MIRRLAVPVRCPGARTAPGMRPCTCCQTGREKTGTKTSMTLLKAIGKASIAILSGEEYMGYHCRAIVTQITKMAKVELRDDKAGGHVRSLAPVKREASCDITT